MFLLQVFLNRQDGSVLFNRTWDEYVSGFESPPGEFWLGKHILYMNFKYEWNTESQIHLQKVNQKHHLVCLPLPAPQHFIFTGPSSVTMTLTTTKQTTSSYCT